MDHKTDTDSERAAFEAWIKKDCGDLSTFGSGAHQHYRNSAVNNAWIAWKARASLAASAGSAPVAAIVALWEAIGYQGAHTASTGNLAPTEKLIAAVRDVEALVTHPSPPEGAGWLQVYRCKIKSRKQIDREIPREQQGWWADVAAGQKLLLRQAVQSDLDRCTLGGKRSKNPADYMCETHTNGSLVSKVALEYMNPEQNVFAAAAPPASEAKERGNG